MSHYGVLVIAPPGISSLTEANEAIEPLLAPYDENVEVPEYEEDCYCVNEEAANHARDLTHDERKAIQDRHKQEWAPINRGYIKLAPKDEKGRPSYGLWEYTEGSERIAELPFSPEREVLLEQAKSFERRFAETYKIFEAKVKKLEEEHPRYKLPALDCTSEEGCYGTGKRKTTYNPKSHWDWYVIGGRWAGALVPEYDPNEDPRNREICWLCRGTGKRKDMEVPDGCNGCNGSGVARKWNNEDFEGDVMPVAAIPNPEWEKAFYALVTPDGQWHQRGRMGWFGMSHDEMTKEEWHEVLRKVVAKYPDHTAVVVDCHI